MQLDLAGKSVIVTGSTQGIGLAAAQGFAREGAHLVICGRDEAKLRRAADGLDGAASVTPVTCDVLTPEGAADLVDAAVAANGGVDVLVNNVGGAVGGRLVENSTDDEWRYTFELNVIQTVRLMRLALPHMAGREAAAIVNVASISGFTPQLSSSGQYAGAKAALINNTQRWALEFVKARVRVNSVSPGAILVPGKGWDTEMRANPAAFEAYAKHALPMGRLGKPEEVADVIVYLASRRSHWVNGQMVPVDGLQQPVWSERHWTGHH